MDRMMSWQGKVELYQKLEGPLISSFSENISGRVQWGGTRLVGSHQTRPETFFIRCMGCTTVYTNETEVFILYEYVWRRRTI